MSSSSKAHCNACGGERNHSVLHSEKTSWDAKEDGICGADLYEMLRCNGCENITFRRTSWSSEDPEATERYFPPSIFRQKPRWINELWRLPSSERFVHELLMEVYSALQNSQPRLAAMGIRSLLEQIMIAKVGDQRTFKANLAEFEAKGFVSPIQRQRLDTILETGHATIHRAFKPSEEDLVTLMDITESIVEIVYVHESKVAALRKRVPGRVN